jgi:leader peptidase (prepilin peptidase)/N-methyltransferase
LLLVARLGEALFKKEAMGYGDVKLLGAIGAFLGWKGVFFTILFSSLFGSVVGVSLVLARGREWQSRIPYGPYIALAAVSYLFIGQALWNWYVGLLLGKPLFPV